MLIDGQPLRKASPAAAMAAGIGYVPEDRRQQGLVMEMSIQQNVGARLADRLQRRGLISSAAERAFAADWAQRLQPQVRTAHRPGVPALRRQPAEGRARPSGSAASPKLLIVDEPTRGIDVGTKAEVHRLLVQLASATASPS